MAKGKHAKKIGRAPKVPKGLGVDDSMKILGGNGWRVYRLDVEDEPYEVYAQTVAGNLVLGDYASLEDAFTAARSAPSPHTPEAVDIAMQIG